MSFAAQWTRPDGEASGLLLRRMRLSDLRGDAKLVGQIFGQPSPGSEQLTQQMKRQTDSITRFAAARRMAVSVAWQGICLLVATNLCLAGVLSQADLKKVETLRPMFAGLMGDLVQTSKRSDISAVDADCVKLTIQNLAEISQELSSYEYLITIEKELTEVGENDPTLQRGQVCHRPVDQDPCKPAPEDRAAARSMRQVVLGFGQVPASSSSRGRDGRDFELHPIAALRRDRARRL